MSAPQGSGGSGGGLSPTTFLGTFSGSNPSNPANGYWWYRVDLGQIWGNINGTIMPIQNTGAVTIISSNTTIANTDVYNDIIVTNNATLTIYGNVTFHGNVIIENGSTLLSSNPNASSSAPQTNNYQFLGNFYLNGTYEIAQYNTDNILNSITLTTINSSSGTNPTLSGLGTLNIGSNTLTINENVTITVSTIAGSGTLSVSSGYTLTQGASITLSIPTVNIAGTWANAGYGITIPSGATVTVTVTGSFTTASTPGTLTVNGTCYWFGAISWNNSSSGLPSFSLSLAGSGIFVGAPSNSNSGGNSISLSNTTLSAGGNNGTLVANSSIYPYSIISSLSGSAVGKYGLGIYDHNAVTYNIFVLIYIGTANKSFSINSKYKFVSNAVDVSGDSSYIYNSSGSAGSITITGTFYA